MRINNPGQGTSYDVLNKLSNISEGITAFRLARLPFAPSIQERANLDANDHSIISRALKYRKEINLPFWDGVLLEAGGSASIPTGVLSAAAFHQPLEGRLEWISPSQIYNLPKNIHPEVIDEIIAVTSLVKTHSGEFKHIPMLDFHIPFGDAATKAIKEVLRILGVKGTLLKSGKSYHFYGFQLLTESDLIVFLGKALLFAPILDRAWIAHQLIERCCSLRISGRTDYGGPPSILFEI